MAFSSTDFRDWVLVAEGGEAEVFRAKQNSLDRLVAIKRLKYAALVNSGAIQRFGGEARLSASLKHSSLVQVFDYGQEGSYWCIVMEYVNGLDFGKLLHPLVGIPPLPLSFKLNLARQLVEVMNFLHSSDVVHRDIKPENVMVDRQGRVKLLDLGLARANPTLMTDPQGATLRGTLAYIAPELLRGQAPYTPRSEYYALALVLLEMFSQKRLLGGGSANEVLSRIQAGPSAESFEALPPALRQPIRDCLRQDPQERPASLHGLLEAIHAESEALGSDMLQSGMALQPYLLRDHRQWLWSEVVRARQEGRIEAAFALAKELLELIPEDEEAQAALMELGTRLNERVDTRSLAETQGKGIFPARHKMVIAMSVLSLVFIVTLYRSISHVGYVEDLGQSLMERQSEQLKNDPDGLGTESARQAANLGPTSRAYGVLVVEGLPRGYTYWVNGSEYRTRKPIQLPEDRYMLEIRDNRKRHVMSDSIAVVPGEPTVFQFEKEGRSSEPHP